MPVGIIQVSLCSPKMREYLTIIKALKSNQAHKCLSGAVKERQEALRDSLLQEQSPRMEKWN